MIARRNFASRSSARQTAARLRAVHFALALALALAAASPATAQISFTDGSARLVNPNLRSGVAMGIADMNGDGYEDLVRLHLANSLEIEYQPAPGGVWTRLNHGSLGAPDQWSLCIGDLDDNGFNDVLSGGPYNGLKILKANPTGTAYNLSFLPPPSIFLQGSNFADIDDDGDLDVFACHDDGLSAPFRNDGAANFVHDIGLINAVTTVPSDNSGNYGSIWTDYDNDGDLDLYISKCRLGVGNPMDGRRLNLLFQNDGANNYTDVALSAGMRPFAQSWSTDFADIDNDGDLDALVLTHDVLSKLYANNGNGTFTDITAGSGMSTGLAAVGLGMQVKFEDFNNDCFVDALVTGRSGQHRLFRNNGNSTFAEVPGAFPTAFGIHSAVTGDLNHDGFVDVAAGFATGYNTPSGNPDRLYINSGGGGNFLKVRVHGTTSNPNGAGARLELYGAWGKQIREIRSGEGYGIVCSLSAHFGVGAATTIDSLVVRWPSGQVCIVASPPVNSFIDVVEGCSAIDCRVVTPASPSSGDINIASFSASLIGNIVDFDFEYSLDGGVTYLTATAAPSSPLANPALAIDIAVAPAQNFIWDSAADGVGTAVAALDVLFRTTVSESMIGTASTCVTEPFHVSSVAAPGCMILGPSVVGARDVQIDVNTFSSGGLAVDLALEHSLDGGATFQTSTAAAGSALANPAIGLAVGAAVFTWDTIADGVGISAPATGVLVRATTSGGGSLDSSTCQTPAFDVDNSEFCLNICGDCDLNGTMPSILDALLAAQFGAGIGAPAGAQVGCCDIDSDADVDVLDSLRMAQSSAGLVVTLICP